MNNKSSDATFDGTYTPNFNLPERTNRIHIGFADGSNIKVESDELSFQDLRKEALDLIEIIKADIMKFKSKPDPCDVA